MRYVAIGAIALAIAIGAGVSGGGGGPPPNPQTFYIATTGNDGNPGTSASPFLTMDKCYRAVTEGGGNSTTPAAACVMKNGSYANQTILWSSHKALTSTCRWGGPFMNGNATAGTTTEAKDLSGCIEFVPENAGGVTLPNLVINAPYVYIEGLTVGGARDTSTGSLEAENDSTHTGTDCTTATFTDIIVRNSTFYWMFLKGVEHFYLINDTFDSQQSAAHSAVNGCDNSGYIQNHLMFDGITVKNQYWENSGQHVEGIQWTACDTCTLQNSKFLNDAQYDISFAFGSGNDNDANHMLIQNNVFDITCSHQNFSGTGGCNGPGSANQMINIGCPGGCTAQHWLIRFNSFYMDLGGSPDIYYGCDCSGGSPGDILSQGNIGSGMQNGFRCGVRVNDQGFTFDHEVYSVAPTCGTNNSYSNTQAATFTDAANYDYTIKSCSTSAEANFVPTSVSGGVPPTDILGNARPSGTNADAGAYESCS